MTNEEKDLLLQDLCARLPYEVKVIDDLGRNYTLTLGNSYLIDLYYGNGDYVEIPIKPCLRPMSSMTESEMEELRELRSGIVWRKDILHDEVLDIYYRHDALDWLLKRHFDTRGLIKIGLAIEAPEGMYND